MRCLVTGGAGFIGSNLVDKLIDDGHEVIIFDNYSTGKKENVNPKAKFFLVDISHQPSFKDKTMEEIMTGVDVVFHLAAKARVQPSIENPIEYHNTNVNGTLNMLDACRRYGVKRFIFSSSSSVYGDVEQLPTPEEHELNPMSPYALHKLQGEQYCKLFSELYDLETVCLRYFNVYGERQNTEGAYCLVMGIFAGQLLKGEPMTINGDGENRRDFTYVGDVVDANIRCMDYPLELNGEAFNIGNGDNRSVNQIANLLSEDGDRINKESVIEPKETLANNSKAKKILGWKPTNKIENWIIDYKEEMGL
mgnify:FL=1|tara:strand:+ start:3021 stop:3941 length:921 start_codon:yes stop_codon:yes gene_type:complete